MGAADSTVTLRRRARSRRLPSQRYPKEGRYACDGGGRRGAPRAPSPRIPARRAHQPAPTARRAEPRVRPHAAGRGQAERHRLPLGAAVPSIAPLVSLLPTVPFTRWWGGELVARRRGWRPPPARTKLSRPP